MEKKMQKKIIFPMLLLTSTVWAGFDFGECSGSGTFEQEIIYYAGDYENASTVGEIPEGIQGLNIQLISDKDVDIRLYGDTSSNMQDKIVHWPHGMLKRHNEESVTYNGAEVTYSGYNGVNNQKGHEFITVTGSTPTVMTMKAFGYRAGSATVNYSWTGKDGCTENKNGTGHFEQEILAKQTSLVGTIPPNIQNVEIKLTSSKDLDIQLYSEAGTPIVSWNPIGLISGSGVQTVQYNGMTIEWSGYNGTNGNKGHEYIKVTGLTTEMLVLKVYGYQAGTADVEYSWGEEDNNTEDIPVLSSVKITEYLDTINAARAVGRTCGDYGYFGPVADVEWSDKLYKASYEHSQDMTTMNYFSHTGSGAESDWSGYKLSKQSTVEDRIENYNFTWTRYSENITASTMRDTAQKAIDSWINSPGHCRNIMDPNVTKVGLAHTQSDTATYTHYWTQNFARGN